MIETAGLGAFQTLWESGVVSTVLVLSLLGLIWMTRNVLSGKDKEIGYRDKVIEDKDETISILRSNMEKRDGYMADILRNQDKMVDTLDRHQMVNDINQNKVFAAIDDCKQRFNSKN